MFKRSALLVACLMIALHAAAIAQVAVVHSHPQTVLAGQEVRVEVELINELSTAQSNITFESIFQETGAFLVDGSVTATDGQVTEYGGENRFAVEGIDLTAGAVVTVSYRLRVSRFWPAGAGPRVAWQASVHGGGISGVVGYFRAIRVLAAPRLLVEKSDGGGVLEPGVPPVVYRIVVENAGTQEATGIRLEDELPSGLVMEPTDSDPRWVCSGQLCRIEGVGLAVGERTSADLAVSWPEPAPAGVAEVVNVVTASDDGNNATGRVIGGEASETTPLDAAPDLWVTMTAGAGSVAAGEVVTIILRVGNGGNQGATGVVLTDRLPTEVTVADATGWSCAGRVCELPIGDLAAGEVVERTLVLRAPAAVPAGLESLVNGAEVEDDGANGADPQPENNSATTVVALDAEADLRIGKTTPQASVVPGMLVLYEIEVVNDGSQAVEGVVVEETLPMHAAWVAGESSDGWACVERSCVAELGSLAAGDARSLGMAVEVAPTVPASVTTLVNHVSVSGSSAVLPDPTPQNNEAELVLPIEAAADLELEKSTRGERVAAGEVLTYELQVSNVGNRDAVGVVVMDELPPWTTIAAASSTPGWVCTSTNCSFEVGELLGGGQSVTLVLGLRVAQTLPAGLDQLVNSAVVIDDEGTGDTDDEITPVDAAPDLALVKDDGGASVDEGGTVSYGLTVTNVGTQEATGVVLEEIVPAGGEVVAEQSPGWVCSAGVGAGSRCSRTVDRLAAGASASAEIVIRALPGQLEQLINSASVADDGAQGDDRDPSNNSARDTTPVNRLGGPDPSPPPQLVALKRDALVVDEDEDGAGDSGDVVTYLVDVTNDPQAGPARAVEILLPTPRYARLLPGTVTTSRGEVLSEQQRVAVRVDVLEPGSMVSVTYDVLVGEVPQGVEELVCQGEVLAANHDSLLTDDPDTITPADATRTPLDSDDSPSIQPHDIPTLGEWVLMLFSLALLGLGAWVLEKRRRGSLIVVVLVGLLAVTFAPAPVNGQWAVFDAANLAEAIKQYLQMVIDYVLQYEDYLVQVEQYRQLYEQLVALEQDLEDFDELTSRELATALHAVQERLSEIDGIIYTRDDVHQRWIEVLDPGVMEDPTVAEPERAQVVLESLRGMVEAARSIGSGSVRSQKDLGALKAQLDGAEGNLQALQAAGIISAHTSEEVSRAVELMAAGVNAQAVAAAYEISQRAAAEATAREWLRSGLSPALPYRTYDGLPILPRSFGDR